jgi:glutamyl/glutaminyl-tRNA synthetase
MNGEEKNKKLANLLFSDVSSDISAIEKKYPERNLPKEAKITRFAPSPTGFVHIGGIFSALISERFAHKDGGIFFLRIEDTDKKREVAGGVDEIISAVSGFDIKYDEGPTPGGKEIGAYCPYFQSHRIKIYKTFAKKLLEDGLAYPCFCSDEELEKTRGEQEKEKIKPGYYGKWAKHRNFTF